ncbi:MAG: sulfatase-like hydrolase/transferase [Spirochaetota bacterium]
MKRTEHLIMIFKAAIIAAVTLLSTMYIPQSFLFYRQSGLFYTLLFIMSWTISIAALCTLSLLKNSVGKTVSVLILGFFMCTADLHYAILGDSLTIEALSNLWSEKGFIGDAFLSFGHLGIKPLIRLTLYLAASFFPVQQKNKFLSGWKTAVCAVTAVAMLAVFTHKPDGIGVEGLPGQFAIPTFGISLIELSIKHKKTRRSPVTIPVRNTDTIDNVIIIVDESIAGDFIDLNVKRNVTPFLLSQNSRIVNYGIALASYNRSNGSNSLLRMGENPEQFKTHDGSKLFNNPLIWQYALDAGYTTTYIDAQVCDKYQNYMDDDERRFIRNLIWIPRNDPSARLYSDIHGAKKIRDIIAGGGKNFIYMNKSGVHFHYENRYPENQRFFNPTLSIAEAENGLTSEDKPRLENSYKNAARWSVDEFFRTLLAGLDLRRTIIIYTSDHGQNLLDDGKAVSHNRRKNAIPQEAIVPLLVITDNQKYKTLFASAAKQNFNRTSHFQIFPTALDLFGYDKKMITAEYTATLFDKAPEIGGFYTGNIKFGYHRQTPVPGDLTRYIRKEEAKEDTQSGTAHRGEKEKSSVN